MTGPKLDSILRVGERYVGPFRWMLSTKLGKTLHGYLNTLYDEFLSQKADVILRLRSKDYLFLWKEILMNIALASDLRLEQFVKLVKTWPEVGSRNILSWWQLF